MTSSASAAEGKPRASQPLRPLSVDVLAVLSGGRPRLPAAAAGKRSRSRSARSSKASNGECSQSVYVLEHERLLDGLAARL